MPEKQRSNCICSPDTKEIDQNNFQRYTEAKNYRAETHQQAAFLQILPNNLHKQPALQQYMLNLTVNLPQTSTKRT